MQNRETEPAALVVAAVVLLFVILLVVGCNAPHVRAKLDIGYETLQTHTQQLSDENGQHGPLDAYWVCPRTSGRHFPAFD